MNRKILALMLAATMIGSASSRTLELVEGAYEAALSDVTLPSSISGTLIFRMCASCEPIARQVNSGTVYVGARGPMAFADFIDYASSLRQTADGGARTGVGIYYDLETNRITRISLHPAASN